MKGLVIVQLIFADIEKCVKCNNCSEICPMRVIGIGEDGYPMAMRDAYKICINCGYCVDVCAVGALKHRVRKRSLNSDQRFEDMRRSDQTERNGENSNYEK